MELGINGGTPLRSKKLQYGKQTIDESDKQAIIQVLDENTYLTTGPRVVEFEEKEFKFEKAKYGVAVNSGTSALHLALDALNLSNNDEVIVTSMINAEASDVTPCGTLAHTHTKRNHSESAPWLNDTYFGNLITMSCHMRCEKQHPFPQLAALLCSEECVHERAGDV